ncbi:MAG: beta-lactamase family protein [Clostridia bacterium]|nr:beta-lactamase family protein [Clostridia bacterium]
MNFSKVDDYLEQLPNYGFPACELAVTHKGSLVYRRAVGFADIEKTRPTSENDLYYVFSVTKTTTCICAMRLVEEGKLGLDDPVSKYLPTYAYLTVKNPKGGAPTPAKETLTVRHLFTMTGGLNYDLNAAPIIRACQDPNATTLDIVNSFAETPLDFEPGTRYQYSLCHDVLAAVVEVVSGMRFADYVQRYMLDPLGMKNTGFHLPEELRPRLSQLYRFVHGAMKAEPMEIRNSFIFNDHYDSGGAGFYSCTTDQIRLMTVMANGGKTEDGYSLLRPETIRMMMVGQLSDAQHISFCPTHRYGYSYGLGGRVHVDPILSRSRAAVGEFGWGGAAGAFNLIDPEKQVALYFATHVKGAQFVYHMVHPTLRDLTYEAIEEL